MPKILSKHKDYLLLCNMVSNREKKTLDELKKTPRKKKEFEQHVADENQLKENGWIPLDTSEELNVTGEGYFGVAYYKIWRDQKGDKYAEVVIAHRGTCFDEKGNILADVQIAQQQPPKILNKSREYIAELFKCDLFKSTSTDKEFYFTRNGEEIPVKKIIHTGFSLGGFIAGACACLSYPSQSNAVTFDAPGVAYLQFPDKDKKSRRVINYVTVPNLVNTCNEHYGEVRQVCGFNKPQKANVKFNISDLSDLGFAVSLKNATSIHWTPDMTKHAHQTCLAFEELTETSKSHDREELRAKSISSDAEYKVVASWPVATTINFSYGTKPQEDIGLIPISFNNSFLDLVFQLAGGYVQMKKHSMATDLWEATKRTDNFGVTEGVIGAKYVRSNSVSYSQQPAVANNNQIATTNTNAMQLPNISSFPGGLFYHAADNTPISTNNTSTFAQYNNM
jgi:hypothetical protein